MRRRELLIAAGVLVPFFVLVFLALRETEPTTRKDEPTGPARIAVKDNHPVVVATAEPLDAGLDAEPAPRPAQAPSGHPAITDELRARVSICLGDANRQTRSEVAVRFTPTRDGGFVGVEALTQDPYLAACISDVFEETPWQPSPAGTESFEPQGTSFSFDPRRE